MRLFFTNSKLLFNISILFLDKNSSEMLTITIDFRVDIQSVSYNTISIIYIINTLTNNSVNSKLLACSKQTLLNKEIYISTALSTGITSILNAINNRSHATNKFTIEDIR